MGESAEDLFRGRAAAAGATGKKRAVGTIFRDCRVPLPDAPVVENVLYRPFKNVTQNLWRVIAKAHVGVFARKIFYGEECGIRG